MATEIVMPRMGYDMTEGKLLRWLKREGQPIARGEPVAEIETDKVSIEIEAYEAGVLGRILVGEGQTVPVGAPIGIIAAPGETLPAAPSSPAASPAPATPRPSSTAAEPAGPARALRAPGAADVASAASPLARRVAQELGVDLSTVQGTGPGGRISREDVLAAAQARSAPPAVPPAPTQPGAAPDTPADVQPGLGPGSAGVPARPVHDHPPSASTAGTRGAEVPLTRLQQTMGRRMLQSKTQAPHFYVSMRVDMTDALAFRHTLNEEGAGGPRVSVNDLVVAATARALAAFPRLNATFAGDQDRLIQHAEIAICIAVALDEGLVTPVVHDAGTKTLRQLAAETATLVERTRAGRNRPEDYAGGTFTISNLGMFDVETFVAIINPPQVAILAVGAVQRVPAFLGEALMPRQMMTLTLSADHRALDGATAARFLTAVRDDLEHPDRLGG